MTAQDVPEARLDHQRQRKAKEYARLQRRLMLVDLVIGVAYLLAWLVFGWSVALRDALLQYTANDWVLVAAFGLVFGGIFYLLNLPLSYYEGYVLPQRYGLSTQTLPAWIADQLKSLALAAVLGGFMLELVYAVLRLAPETWWLWTAGLLLLVNVLLANLAPVLLFPIFYKFKPLDDEYAELAGRLLSLTEKAQTRVRGVYQFDLSRRTTAANAALTGLGNTRRIILGDTLLREYTYDEIETVLAHELGHHVHKDIPIGILVESLLTLVGLYLAALVLNWGVVQFGLAGPADIAGLPLLGLIIGFYGLITMPVGNAFSRWRERRADEYALQATGKSAAFASAMTRLANQNLADADPEPWVVWLFYSHPPLGERIAAAQAYSRS